MRFGERDGHQIFLEPEGLNVVVEPSSTRLLIESVANPPPCVPRTCAYPPPPHIPTRVSDSRPVLASAGAGGANSGT